MADTLATYQVPEHHVKSFTSNVLLAVQRKGGVFRPYATQGSYVGEDAQAVDFVGPAEFNERTVRLADTQLSEFEHKQRWIAPKDYDFATMVDRLDRLRMLYDPMSPYVESARMGAARKEDDAFIAAFFANARTGKLGATSTPYRTANTVAVGSTGLSVAKLRAMRKMMKQANIDLKAEQPYIACSAQQIDDLLGETQVTNSDYAAIKALVDGEVTRFMGFEFVQNEALLSSGVSPAATMKCPVWVKSGMHWGDWQSLVTTISPRPDKNNLPQLHMSMTFGVTRIDESKVFEIDCLY
ncbi:phage capsid protein [Hyphomicrobium sp. DY-1]|uniref:phage capsid protein n=1 Tax=Hyphomicrobium sp. DY-1 TaxID=3075650 RepID=UPI0039C44ECB